MVRRFRPLAMLIALLVCRAVAQTDAQTPYPICGSNHPASEGRPCATSPRAISAPDPKYPEKARHDKIQGTVLLWLEVGADGKPSNFKVTRGVGHGLDEEAIDAVKQWKFEPATLNGKPVPVMINVEVNFRLAGKRGEQAVNPPSPYPTTGQGADTLFANASSAQAMNDCGRAIPLAIRVTEMYPQHHAAWNLLGLCYLELDELQKAEDAFKRQIEVAPQSAFAYSNLGRVYARKGNYDMASVQFRKQIEINPRDRYAHMNLAGNLRSQKKCDQAIPEYQLAAQLTPENPGPHVGLARCYFDQGQQESGIAELNTARALTSSGPGWNTLAWTMAEYNLQLDRAEQDAKLAVSMESSALAAVSLDPLTPGAYGRTRALAAAWDTLGWILFLRGDFTSAEKYLMAAWTLLRSPTSSDHLAQLAEKLGRKDDSLKYSALAVAERKVPSQALDADGEAVLHSKERLERLAPSPAVSHQLSEDAQHLLEQQDSFALPNPAKHQGSAEFALLRVQGQSSAKARWMAGDASLKAFETEVAARIPAGPADVGAIDLLRWGTLSCEKSDAECNIRLSSAREAVYAQLRSTVKPATATTDSNGAAISPAPTSTPAASTPGQSPQHVQLAEGTSQGLLIYKVPPSYPPLARQARVQGMVVFHAIIGKDGSVQDLQVITGHPLLIQAAMDAIKQWRYKPYLLNGEPVIVQTTINVNFALSGDASGAPLSVSHAANAAENVSSDPVLSGLQQEMRRSFDNLKKPPVPVYFLAYQLTDNRAVRVSASFGALLSSADLRTRLLDVDLRVGDYTLDNTHAGGSRLSMNTLAERFGETPMPIEGAVDVLQRAIWAETDRKYKIAVERWQDVKTATAVKAEQEDRSADFSHEAPRQYTESEAAFSFDRKVAEDQARRYSAQFAKHPGVLQGTVEISGELETRRFVNSEGSVIKISTPFYRIMVNASTRAADGMQLPLHLSYLAFSPESLPNDQAVLAAIDQLSEKLAQLSNAPVAEPYTGPAILSGRASAVFFHEIFGHRVEGARQKSQEDAQTFKRQVNQRVLPDFLSVYSDPTQLRIGKQDLVGYYKYDDEGVQAARVAVVENGILKNFLMSRSPIQDFPQSNAHGRRQQGNEVAARQSNLIVQASQAVSRAELKKKLIELVKAANKPYGLYFEDVEGGFTFTQRFIPNAFSVRPTVVYRIYPDGREELVRGLDLIGTPLIAFSKIVAADDEVGVFNGLCGAESGWVPVSAVSPGLLVSQMEVQLKAKSQQRAPVLPRPSAKP